MIFIIYARNDVEGNEKPKARSVYNQGATTHNIEMLDGILNNNSL